MPIYGIDLGTTKSIIGINGKMSSKVPSVANLSTGAAGKSEYTNYNALRNYKVDMQMSTSGKVAIIASACVLKELKRVFGIGVDQPIDAVISVPAYFGGDQCAATIKAASLANINVKSLIKEPTAAAIFLRKNKNGVATIFDLGGGTLDVSVIRMENGKAVVLATDGCILGGKDLDIAIGKYFQQKYGIPTIEIDDEYYTLMQEFKLLRSTTPATQLCSYSLPERFKAKTLEFSIVEYCNIVTETFKRSIDIAKSAILASGIDIKDMSFYFVGGSTHCSILRTLVENGLGVRAEQCNYNRDFAVANGAVYYASLLEQGVLATYMQDASKLLSACVDGDAYMQPLIYKNSGLPVKTTTAFLLADNNDALKKEYSVELFYGDCSLNIDTPENNNKLVDTVVVKLDGEVTTKDDTLVVVTSSLAEDGNLTVKLQVPLQPAITIERKITL